MTVAASTVRLATGITPADLALEHSHDGHHLLIYHGAELLAIYGAMAAESTPSSSPTVSLTRSRKCSILWRQDEGRGHGRSEMCWSQIVARTWEQARRTLRVPCEMDAE